MNKKTKSIQKTTAKLFLGLDVGSMTTKAAIIDESNNILASCYIRTEGSPMLSIQRALREVQSKTTPRILAAGTTGSGRELAKLLIGADIAKNEITAHATAALAFHPNTRTIFEIGGQDSKVIILKDGVVIDFAMNSVCAAGTGSFLDQQASRIGIPIEDFGDYALRSKNKINIAGRCTVFAESDMIHKQQLGFKKEDLINGLCHALARNYLNNICKGKNLEGPILFQGGVASNMGLKKAFEEQVGKEIIVPKHHNIMGAVGAAMIARRNYYELKNSKNKKSQFKSKSSNFKGFDIAKKEFTTKSFTCHGCSNTCEVVQIFCNNKKVAVLGSRCGKYN